MLRKGAGSTTKTALSWTPEGKKETRTATRNIQAYHREGAKEREVHMERGRETGKEP